LLKANIYVKVLKNVLYMKQTIRFGEAPKQPEPQESHENKVTYTQFHHQRLHGIDTFDIEEIHFLRFPPGSLGNFRTLLDQVLRRVPLNCKLAEYLAIDEALHRPLRDRAGADQILLPNTIWQASFAPKKGSGNLFFPSLNWIGVSWNGEVNVPVHRWYTELVNLDKQPVQAFVVPVLK
jgi:hypothetical protein